MQFLYNIAYVSSVIIQNGRFFWILHIASYTCIQVHLMLYRNYLLRHKFILRNAPLMIVQEIEG